jgi:hypothetical protein
MWRRVNKPELGMMNVLSNKLGDMEDRRPGNFPTFNPTEPLVIISDYGGSHQGSRFETYSFLFTQPSSLPEWNTFRLFIREKYRFQVGRMAYKKLNNRECGEACFPWLTAADQLNGLLITFAIDRSLGSRFNKAELAVLRQVRTDLAGSPRKTIERMFLVCHFIAVVLAGLWSASQEVIWITDQDDIAANEKLQSSLEETLQNVALMYLGERLNTLHCGTTAFDDGVMQVEDLASIPDLMAGAISEAQTQQAIYNSLPTGHGNVALPVTLPEKTMKILHWTALPDKSLRRMVLAMYPTANPEQVYFNRIVFQSEAPARRSPSEPDPPRSQSGS